MKKTHPRKIKLRAAAAKTTTIQLRGAIQVEAAAAGKGARRFSMNAYDGAPFRPHSDPPVPHPIVVDLAGLDVSKQIIPALKDHDSKAIVGHTDKIAAGTALTAEGVVSGAGPAAKEVLEAHDNGFPWQVSMGAQFDKLDFVPAGRTVHVNARAIPGPVYVARKGRLREVSFLSMAADDDTSATIAAQAAEGSAMDFAAWLEANGFGAEDTLDAKQKIVLKAAFKRSQDAQNDGADDDADAPVKSKKKKKGGKPAATIAASEGDDTLAGEGDDTLAGDGADEIRTRLDAMERRQEILALCGEKHTEIAAKAVKNGWNDETIKMAIRAADLEASLPKTFQITAGKAADAPAQGLVLEAACALAGGLKDVEKHFDEKALIEAGSQFKRGISLQELVLTAAHANGYRGWR